MQTAAAPPRNLTLEKLHLRVEDNLYWAAPGQRMVQWGPLWTEHKWFETIAAFRAALGIERGSQTVEPAFVDLASRDLRLAAGADPAVRRCYPRGAVPGVRLDSDSP